MLQSYSSLEILVKRMNLDLKNLSQWLKANKFSLNVTKKELIIFHSCSTKMGKDGKRLTQTYTVKYLGFLLDDYLLRSKQN